MDHPQRVRTLAALAAVLIGGASVSCNTPDQIAKFCSSAVVTLKCGDAFFDDMRGSCVRAAQARDALGTIGVADAEVPACNDIGERAEGLEGASKIVTKYFVALNELASFGKGRTDDSKDSKAKLSGSEKALTSIAGFLTRAATGAYQQKKLADEIVSVHEDVTSVLHGLGEAVGVAYVQQLEEEERKTAARYKDFLLAHPNAPEAMLTLDARWAGDRAAFAAKRRAARNYQAALETMAKCNDELAAHAREFKAAQMAGLLAPYAAQLESLVPVIQKGF